MESILKEKYKEAERVKRNLKGPINDTSKRLGRKIMSTFPIHTLFCWII